MLPLRQLLYFAHSKRHNFLPTVVYFPHTHTAHSIVVVLMQVRWRPCFILSATQREWETEVGGRQGSLVRKEMSCYPVMTMLVREHLWQHQRASNYNQFPLQNASKTLHSSNKRGCQQSGLPLRWQPCVDRPGERAFVSSTAVISGSLC